MYRGRRDVHQGPQTRETQRSLGLRIRWGWWRPCRPQLISLSRGRGRDAPGVCVAGEARPRFPHMYTEEGGPIAPTQGPRRTHAQCSAPPAWVPGAVCAHSRTGGGLHSQEPFKGERESTKRGRSQEGRVLGNHRWTWRGGATLHLISKQVKPGTGPEGETRDRDKRVWAGPTSSSPSWSARPSGAAFPAPNNAPPWTPSLTPRSLPDMTSNTAGDVTEHILPEHPVPRLVTKGSPVECGTATRAGNGGRWPLGREQGAPCWEH